MSKINLHKMVKLAEQISIPGVTWSIPGDGSCLNNTYMSWEYSQDGQTWTIAETRYIQTSSGGAYIDFLPLTRWADTRGELQVDDEIAPRLTQSLKRRIRRTLKKYGRAPKV